jgi:hypothetical protein
VAENESAIRTKISPALVCSLLDLNNVNVTMVAKFAGVDGDY